jgi:hypothetical protein
VVPEAIQQVLGLALLLSSSFLRPWFPWGRMGQNSFCKQPVIAVLETGQLGLGQRLLPFLLSAVDDILVLDQQLGQTLSPVLVVLLVDEQQLAQMVSITQTMFYSW